MWNTIATGGGRDRVVLGLFPLGVDEPADEALVATIVDMGHRLGMHVVAEGVEREEELTALAAVGCDSGQGYLYSPPVPAGRFPVELLSTAARTTPAAGYQVLSQPPRPGPDPVLTAAPPDAAGGPTHTAGARDRMWLSCA